MYIYTKTSETTATYTLNTDTTIWTGKLTFTSPAGGTVIGASKNIADESLVDSGPGTFTIKWAHIPQPSY